MPFSKFLELVHTFSYKIWVIRNKSCESDYPNELSEMWNECREYGNKWITENEEVSRKMAKMKKNWDSKEATIQRSVGYTHKEEQALRNKWLLVDWEAKKNVLTSNLEGSQMNTRASINRCITWRSWSRECFTSGWSCSI